MAFNLLANLSRSSPSTSNSSPVDAEEGELDESDIENGGEEEEEGSGDEYRPSNAVTSHRSRSRPRPIKKVLVMMVMRSLDLLF
ncbi:hypothetical protein RRG08_024091 [Elysia crispata]|uniref:Uncharacterized protein n=1 Tax=Elysia crispata TaxID=231223 RepID=A0AAE1DJL8_9GAST|nr:hypothetical protein RRG08_024091 [Elysia crispata]